MFNHQVPGAWRSCHWPNVGPIDAMGCPYHHIEEATLDDSTKKLLIDKHKATKNRPTVSPSHAAMGGGLHFDNMAAPSPSTAATEVGRKGGRELWNS